MRYNSPSCWRNNPRIRRWNNVNLYNRHVRSGSLLLAERGYLGAALWRAAAARGAELLWRGCGNTSLPVSEELAHGSFLSTFVGAPARVVEYTKEDSDEPLYRLLTTLVDPSRAPAVELAALYHEPWEIETADYHAWRKRPLSQRAAENAALPRRIRPIHEQSRQSYGPRGGYTRNCRREA